MLYILNSAAHVLTCKLQTEGEKWGKGHKTTRKTKATTQMTQLPDKADEGSQLATNGAGSDGNSHSEKVQCGDRPRGSREPERAPRGRVGARALRRDAWERLRCRGGQP